jgi:glycosyltransferase involved in cell wall biosynthesis
MEAAIYYHPEAYTTAGPKLMGRNAAGESFLRGFLQHSRAGQFWVQAETKPHAQHFAAAVRDAGRAEPVRAIIKGQQEGLAGLSQAGTVYMPGPGLAEPAWARAGYGHAAWSLCGITHTTSSARAMDAIAGLLTAPVQPWDALICTSRAVLKNVQTVLQAQVDFLQARLGAQRLVLPQLPVIPLGIHTQDFVFSAEQRSAARVALQLPPNAVVVLFMGRLSFHAKAHPLAMYQALQMVAQEAGRPLVLIECGWHANDYIAQAYAAAAAQACPDVKVHTLDGRLAQDRQTAWAAADVFCSLSDNIQETFGITPIEAMAAGLPVVVSDWDGYKDTVRDGVDGFRIPTTMPPPGLAADLAARHALEIDTYDMYCGHTCSLVAVDIPATAAALQRLVLSEELRRQMGEQGRRRAVEAYDWKVVIGQYEALWARLAELRAEGQQQPSTAAHPWPARMDPFAAFAGYATRTLTPETQLTLPPEGLQAAQARLAACRPLAMVDFARYVLPSQEELDQVLQGLASGPRPAGQLVKVVGQARQAAVFRALAWLLKINVLRVVA